VAVSLNDPREHVLEDCGIVSCMDPETGKDMVLDTSDRETRRVYAARALVRAEARARVLRSINVDHVELWTDRPFIDKLARFFDERRRRIR
jgi:uncharacterized protein (DUF58 family)